MNNLKRRIALGILALPLSMNAQVNPPEKVYLDYLLERRVFTPSEVAALDLTGNGGNPDGVVDVRDLVFFLNTQAALASARSTGSQHPQLFIPVTSQH